MDSYEFRLTKVAQALRSLILFLTLASLLTPMASRPASGEEGLFITGKVVDENATPVREAVITISSPPLADIQATSDAAGLFQIQVPASGNYKVEARREGFFVLTEPAVMIDAGTPIELQMSHLKELAESVDVNYSPPVIDAAQTSDTKRLNNQEILNVPFPASQDYRNALPLMPGALLDNAGQIHFNGGETREANYRLNGFDISDPATGGLTARLNVDTIQTLEWDASRYSAAEGRGSSGTVDIKTEMGDNRWRFGATNFIPGFGSQDGLHLDHWSPRLRFSGPIRRNRAWFHNSLETYYTVTTISGLPPGQDRTRSFSGSDLARLQWNITPAQILTVSFLGNIGDDRRNGLNFLNPVETTLNRRSSMFVGTVKDQWSVGGGLIELGFADNSTYLRASPQGTQTYVVTPYGSRGNFFSDQTAYTGRQEWLVNGFLKPMRRAGTHQIEIGADVEHSDIDQLIDRHEFTTVRVDNSLVRDVQFLGSPRQFRNNIEAYGYLLDRWSLSETLTIEGGVRTQWDEYTGGAPAAPRLAAAWSPKWSHGTKLAAGWGIFYDPTTLNMLALSQEQVSISTFYDAHGDVTGPPIETRFVLRPQDIRLPRYAMTSFSIERPLGWGLFGKVNLISRRGSRGFTFEDSTVSPTLNLYVLDNIRQQRYRAAEFAVRRTFLSKYEWFASYTRSAAHANAVVNYSVENPILTPQAAGPLPWDAPNRFVAWAWAPVEKAWFPGFLQRIIGETDLQLLADFRSGFPFNAVTETGNIVGPPASLRFPDYATINLAVERRFLFRGYLWAWRVSAVNTLNRTNANVVNNDVDSPTFLTYGRGQARAVNVRLRFLGRK
ncbi:MAG TPA: carboxypeptidase regulatory-like domain-containing protein [Bryobacteraceae bacterium]|jgi:hypothetical protein|nr:carboxypeptidase regulatory-like domain-containing protein [Bryobacteraceae bacterium]